MSFMLGYCNSVTISVLIVLLYQNMIVNYPPGILLVL